MITLRLGSHHSQLKEAQALIDAIKNHPGSCDTVWFSTCYGFPKPDSLREEVEQMELAANLFRNAGINVSLQISNTLGHGEYIKRYDCSGLVYESSPAEHMVDATGTAAEYCFCWRGEHVLQYLKEVFRLYAKIKPQVIWFDDDLRADNHHPVEYGCYCDTCIAAFNSLYQTEFSRETLVWEINYGDPKWRERYIAFCRQGISDFVSQLARTFVEVSPETRMGLQCCHVCNYMGSDYNHIIRALEEVSGHSVFVRPGGGYYHDKDPLGQFGKAMRLSATNAILPDTVTHRAAEIENTPDVAFGKSIGGTVLESTLYLASGCNALTYASLMSPNEPISWHEKMLAKFAKARPYWERLAQVSKNGHCSGAAILHPQYAHLRKMSAEERPFSWIEPVYMDDIKLLTTGLPITHDQHAPTAYLLHYDMVDQLTNEEIDWLLTKNVMTDAASVDKLRARGFGDCLPITVRPLTQEAMEQFTTHPVNEHCAGAVFRESFFLSVPMKKYTIHTENPAVEILGEAVNSITGRVIGASAVITPVCGTDGSQAGKWAVFGYCFWNDIISANKRNQLLNALDALKPLPALLRSSEQAAVIPVANNAGQTIAVTIASASVGGTDELELLVRKPMSGNLQCMTTTGRVFTPKAEHTPDGLALQLPKLQPYEILTVFFT